MNTNTVQTAADGVKVKLMTIKELSESLGVDYIKASGLVACLVEQGAIKCVGSKSMEGKRGKPSSVYEFPEVIELCFWQDEIVTKSEVIEDTETVSESVVTVS